MKQKKRRGLRKYFKRLESKTIQIPMTWIKDGYCSYDKIWIDHNGFNGINQRLAHIECLIRNFDFIALQISKHHAQFQIWILINEYSGTEDCILLHTQNPLTVYPHKYKEVQKSSNFKNTKLIEFIEMKKVFNTIYGTHLYLNDKGKEISENYCILYKSELGDSIV